MRAYIQSTISRNCLYYTFESETAHEMLIELQKRFKPTDQLRELDLANRYQKLKESPQSQDLDTWLQSWEKTYHECDKAKLPSPPPPVDIMWLCQTSVSPEPSGKHFAGGVYPKTS
jgi:hypothetical protein